MIMFGGLYVEMATLKVCMGIEIRLTQVVYNGILFTGAGTLARRQWLDKCSCPSR